MQHNPVKHTLRSGGVAVGTMVFEFHTVGLPRIAAAAGAEFVLLDMEHTGWSIETVKQLIATSRPAETVPIVRVPACEYHFIARVLDMGAMGVMVPMVESEEQARRLAASAKYPPDGRRGAAFGIAHDAYVMGNVTEPMQAANREQLLIAQIETRAGLENVEAIAAVDGIDVLWIGQFDLTTSLGIPGRFDRPEFHEAVDRVLAACRRHNRAAGYMAMSVAEARTMLSRGFRCLAYSGDLWIYQQALREGVAGIRAAAGEE
ncbi:MAG TPA: aldolase/citrate lyase family protein [Planctomycetaceae bacterium]|nr:aldolase/citrate lyase family protein [Planctomycetaceae bacterium]